MLADFVPKATAWNRSVDFHWYVRSPFYFVFPHARVLSLHSVTYNSASDVASARRFSDLAMSLAGLIEDSGATLRYLQTKLLDFNWSS